MTEHGEEDEDGDDIIGCIGIADIICRESVEV